MKFLLIEDDKDLASTIQSLLSEHHYVMDLATDGIMGREFIESFTYDLILLDWTLPKLDGIQLCQHLRNEGNYTPIILMTARDDSSDKVTGLDAGADDYLVKPFGFEELLARIRALLRRAEGIVSSVLQWGELCLDPRSSEVTCHGVPVALTPKEYALLELFLRNPSRIFSLDSLLDRVWPFDESPSVGSVRTHIKGLRQKLKKAGLSDIIETVYGLGYRLKTTTAIPNTAVAGYRERSSANPKIETTRNAEETTQSTPAVADAGVAQPASTGRLDIAALWQTVRENYLQRAANLAGRLRSLQPGLIDKAVQSLILKEAHSLAGSLGSFGFTSATTQCREIETTLRTNTYLSIQHLQILEALVNQVQQTLSHGLQNNSASTSVDSGSEKTPNKKLSSPKVVSASSVHPVPVTSIQPPGQMFQMLMVEAQGDRSQTWLQTLSEIAPYYRLQVSTTDSLEQARSIIFSDNSLERPQIVVFDFDGMPDLPNDNSSVFQLLAELQSAMPPIPTIVLTAADSFESRVRVARRGVAALLQTLVTPTELLETTTRVLQKGIPPSAKLLIADDDPALLSLLKELLQPWGFVVYVLSESAQFWQTLERIEPDLVLLDAEMPEINGFDLCQVLRNSPRWHDMPVLFMSAHTDADTIQRVFSAGADDYIRKPIIAPELVARVLGWLERSRNRQLRAEVDSRTGVDNRQKSTQLLTQLLGLARRQEQTLCFALIDFDHFRQINNQYGHSVGDRILKRFGASLKSTFRTEDVVGRWGTEEFVVGLYGMSREEGMQKLRQLVQSWQREIPEIDLDTSYEQKNREQENCKERDNLALALNFTAGVAVYPHDGNTLESLYRAAEKALEKTKVSSRIKVSPVT